MTQKSRTRVVRARQRDRADAFTGFDKNLAPRPSDWCIDRFTFILRGTWRSNGCTGQAFFENRFDDPEYRWLRAAVGTRASRSVSARSPSPLTLGKLDVLATGCSGEQGWIVVNGTVNPTRTLSALLLKYGERENFLDFVRELDAINFFDKPSTQEQLSPSLDGNHNYLPSRPAARLVLSPDPFALFMPIYIIKLREILERAISAAPGEVSYDGTDQVFRAIDGEVRLNWGTVEVPQAETYFERYHSRAVAAVRTASSAIIDGDPNPAVRLYPTALGFEREEDCFMASLTVTERHRLNIYAKTANRIRFEIKRHGRGRYDEIGGGSAADHRILGILIGVERTDAARLVDWLKIFCQFDEPDVPAIGDLVELISAVYGAANGNHQQGRTLIDRLIVDGGFSRGAHPDITDAAITALVQAGVIGSVKLRKRRQPGQARRYSLTAEYASLRLKVLSGLSATRPPISPE